MIFLGARLRSAVILAICALSVTGCDNDPSVDAGGRVDAARVDGGVDAGSPEVDAGSDAGLDAGSDAGSDAGPFDGGIPMSTTFPPRDLICSPPGAAQPCQTTQPARSDAERTVDVTRDMSETALTFVISSFSMPEATALGTAAGLNIDGMDSGPGSPALDANCEAFNQDFTSLRDPSHVGIDNALQEMIPTLEGLLTATDCPGSTSNGCLEAGFANDIAEGRTLLLVEVTGLDSYAYDDAVEVAIYAGAVSGGGAPMLGGDGRLSRGQTFDTMSTLIAPTAGDVFAGRLRVAWVGTIDLPSTPTSAIPNLDDPELRADISAAGLTLGVISATTEVDALVAQAEGLLPGIMDTLRLVLESVSDVSPSADPVVCERISSGFFVEAVPAIRRP